MRKLWIVLGVLGVLSAAALPGAWAADHHKEEADSTNDKLPACPVMGGTIDFTVKTMTDEGPVYFCCAACIEPFKKEPEKFAEKVKEQRETLSKRERIQVSCPVSGRPADEKTAIKVEDRTVAFCCPGCPDAYKAEPAKYRAKLEDSYTYQTRCPVSGQKIKPAAYKDLPTGQRVYFCCKECPQKFLADPAPFAPKLAEQGINIDLKKMKPDKE